MARLKKKNLRKYIVFPACYLVLNLLEEVIVYKSKLIDNPYGRTALLVFTFSFGISFVAFLITPFVEASLDQAHKSSSKKAGTMGEVTYFIILLGIFYFFYYLVYIHGVETIIPQFLLNKIF